MIKNVIIASLFFCGSVAMAQSNLLNAKVPSEIGKKTPAQLNSDNDKPLPYGYVHDRDVLMGKTTWETIDLDERINFPLYYPIDTTNIGKDRRSLFDVLLKGIKSGKITEVYTDSYFNTKKTFKDMESSFTFIDTTNAGKEEINNYPDDYKSRTIPEVVKKDKKGNVLSVTPATVIPAIKVLDPQYINKKELGAIDVADYKIKGFWYFDKRQSELKYRLIGICPVSPEAKEIGADSQDFIELFWVYFPAVREILHDAKAFNNRNSAMPVTFDDLLNSRRFNGEIYKEENVYGDREIAEYMRENSQMQLIESERVKDKIRDFEQDMWNY
ncbi:MAG: Gliding motility protein precursor GldN [Bacteroidota bacterium]|jgi:gliding motility associated protien GldN